MKEGAKSEMDGLRRLVSGRLRAQTVGPHPAPDVLSAFAENALREAERAQLLQHLGACKDCREVLFLAMPDSAEAQKVLSFQPKRGSALVFRWGALAASVVIVGVAVTARYAPFHPRTPAATKAPISTYAKVAEEKVPPEVGAMRGRAKPRSEPPPAAKERPEAKHMTAKPQAGMEFDDSGQVRISQGLKADESKKSGNDDLAATGRSVLGLASPAPEPKPVSPSSAPAGMLAEDKSDIVRGYANVSAGMPAAKGALGGTIIDLSGAAVGNAKVTTVGPIGSEVVTSDAQGKFRFDSLAPGTYSIKAEANGFKSSETRRVAVLDEKTSTVGVKLEPANVSEAVEVSGQAVGLNDSPPAVAETQPTQTVNGFVLGQKQVGQGEMQRAAVTNPPQRAKALLTPQWTLSPEGGVERSLDFGKTWQNVSLATKSGIFRALCSVGTHVWVGGSAGVLFHSADSGQSWSQVQIVSADQKLTSDITHIEFSDPSNGSVTTTNGEVWSTSDGGQTWRRK